ncbi:MAG: NUDIX hydrolase [Candidatus Paceibacterota bacterium]|jgi:ADP-ribose pyrophosphatase YjhB (NUDIX family)
MSGKLYVRDSVSSETILAISRGKRLSRVVLIHPITEKVETWIFYDQQNWSVTMAVTEDGMVVTTWQYYQGVDETLQVLTGGNDDVDGGESPEEVARRELREEGGYDAQEVIALGILPLSVRNSQTRCSLFLALGCKQWQDGSFDKNEVIRVELVPLEEWIRRVFNTIKEGPSREATFLALPHLVRRFPSLDINKILGEI